MAPEVEGAIPLHTRLIEQPAGNDYLNRGLWEDTVDPLPHELSQLLAANGFRVGVISGVIPSELEQLGTSDAAVVSSMMRTAHPGQPKNIGIHSPVESLNVPVYTTYSGEPRSLSLTSAECVLSVSASPQPNGKLQVRCEPQIRHGGTTERWRASSDGTRFESQFEQPTESFPNLAWEVILGPNEVLVFGATSEPDDRLGYSFFFTTDGYRSKQRVLTIQVGASGSASSHRTSIVTAALVK
jgi:hypothetical protein